MKNLILLSSFCLLLPLMGATSLAQDVLVRPTSPAGVELLVKPQQTCPRIHVSCPSGIKAGEPIDFRVGVEGGDPNLTLTYRWEVFGGVLIEGQGTSAIRVKKIGRQGVTAAISIGGLDNVCAKTASCSMAGDHLPILPKQLDSYGSLSRKKEIIRLKLFADQLRNQPGSQGYVLSYGGRGGFAGELREIVERATAYLINEADIHPDRIVTVNGGFRENLTVELWIVPTGSVPPTPEPTVDPSDVKLMKPTRRKTPSHQRKH